MTSWNNLHSLSWQARLYVTSLQNMVTDTLPASLLGPTPMLTEVFSKVFIPVSHCPFSHSETLKSFYHATLYCFIFTQGFLTWKERCYWLKYATYVSFVGKHIFKKVSKKLEKICFTSDCLLFLKYILYLQASMTLLSSSPSTCKIGHLSRPKSSILTSA